MSLILCPDCGNQVSDKAPSCPKCACPISQPVFSGNPRSQVIELTGKKYKSWKLIAVALIILGFVTAIASMGSNQGGPGIFAGFAVTCGLVLYIVSRVAAWWNHG